MAMSQVWVPDPDLEPDLSHLVTEDDKPVDNRFSERQQRLLPHILFSSWDEGKPFEALSDVGLFYALDKPAVAPDFMLSLGVTPRPVTSDKKDRSYLTWVHGKPPELVIEVVSNLKGEEMGRKMELYKQIRIAYYVIYDPFCLLSDRKLRAYQLSGTHYTEILVTDPFYLEEIGLGLTLWNGVLEDVEDCWLRFVDRQGQILPTGHEMAQSALAALRIAEDKASMAEEMARLAEDKARLAEEELEKAKFDERRALALKLREQGVDSAVIELTTGLSFQDL